MCNMELKCPDWMSKMIDDLKEHGEATLEHSSKRLYWCQSHNRKATHMTVYRAKEGSPAYQIYDADVRYHCAPGLGGVMIPCRVVDLTNDIEISDE